MLKNLKKISLIATIATTLVLNSAVGFSYKKLHNGFYPGKLYVTCYKGFSSATKLAVNNANLEINKAGAGNLVYRTTYDHTTTDYPKKNSKNEITSGLRGTNQYLMETVSTCYTSGPNQDKAIEADIDINVSFDWGSNPKTTYDIQNVITHEICHALGLDDLTSNSEKEYTMYKFMAKGETKRRTLESDDKNGLIAIYKK